MESTRKPNARQIDLLSSAAFHRGAIITSYSQVEFLLADLVLRWRTQRNDEEGKLPWSLEARIKAARDVMNEDDRFKEYRSEAESLTDGLKPYRQIRDMMAHGMLIMTTDRQERHQLDYRMLIEVGRMTTDIDQLAYAASEVGKYAQRFVSLWRRIYLDQKLEPVA